MSPTAASQQIEAIVRKTLGPSDVRASVVGVGNSTAVIPMTTAPAGERYGEVPGYYFERRRATIPAVARHPHAAVAGDVVNVIVLAGGLQKEFRYRVAATRQDATKKRVLVVAAEDYKGVSPNVNTAGYDTAPRYLDTYKTALEGLGYEVATSTSTTRRPPAARRTASSIRRSSTRPTSACSRTSTRSSTSPGDDFVPQDVTNTDPQRMTNATAQTGLATRWPAWFHHAMLELRDYANEGGKLIVAGRNVHQAPTSTSTGLTATGPYTWTPDKLFGFNYPDNNGGDDDLPGTAFLRSRTTSNDTWQNYLGVVGRSGGIGTAVNATTPTLAGAPVAPSAGGLFAGMPAIAVDSTAGNDPNQNADGTPLPLAKIPLRLRNWAAGGNTNEPLRQERIEADYTTDPGAERHGRRDHLDA